VNHNINVVATIFLIIIVVCVVILFGYSIYYYVTNKLNYRCPVCGKKATDIKGLGKLGCPSGHTWSN